MLRIIFSIFCFVLFNAEAVKFKVALSSEHSFEDGRALEAPIRSFNTAMTDPDSKVIKSKRLLSTSYSVKNPHLTLSAWRQDHETLKKIVPEICSLSASIKPIKFESYLTIMFMYEGDQGLDCLLYRGMHSTYRRLAPNKGSYDGQALSRQIKECLQRNGVEKVKRIHVVREASLDSQQDIVDIKAKIEKSLLAAGGALETEKFCFKPHVTVIPNICGNKEIEENMIGTLVHGLKKAFDGQDDLSSIPSLMRIQLTGLVSTGEMMDFTRP